MENQSEKLDHQVAGLPSLCLASSRIQFSVHTGDRGMTSHSSSQSGVFAAHPECELGTPLKAAPHIAAPRALVPRPRPSWRARLQSLHELPRG
jgi:hypothetical protein